MCWTTGGQVRRAGLRAGRFVEWDYERGGSSSRTTSGEVRRGRTTSGQVHVSIIFLSPRLTNYVI